MTDPQASAPQRSDRVYGAVALIFLALAAFFALRGGPSDGAGPPPPTPLTILEPAAAEALANPLVLVFDAGTELQPGPAGWVAAGRHVHLRIDETELMAGVGDMQPVAGTRYRWVLPRLSAGEHTLQLFWSDEAHRPLRTGASPPLQIRLR